MENHLVEVSVIIPNYNYARFLKQRIESVLSQTYTDFEIILLIFCFDRSSFITPICPCVMFPSVLIYKMFFSVFRSFI